MSAVNMYRQFMTNFFSQGFFLALQFCATVTTRWGRSDCSDSPSWTSTGSDRFLSEIWRCQQSISNKAKWQGNFYMCWVEVLLLLDYNL